MEDLYKIINLGYSFGSLIGKGSYGKVYKAKYIENSGKIVELACKYIIRNKCPNHYLKKFLPRELDILKQISHPHIIKIHSCIELSHAIFIFMNLEEKGDLLDYIKRNGLINEPDANIWFYQLATAINYLHSLNIAHRDLKCENILISSSMQLKIADFGFARFAIPIEDNFYMNTEYSETYCGSAAYAPPEIVSGTPYDIMKVDVWSLGVILFIMINGRMPFDNSNIPNLIQNQKLRKYNKNIDVMIGISLECEYVINKCLEPDPIYRWTCRNLLNAPWLKLQIEKQRNKK